MSFIFDIWKNFIQFVSLLHGAHFLLLPLHKAWYGDLTYSKLECFQLVSFQKMIALALVAGITKSNYANLSTSGIKCFWPFNWNIREMFQLQLLHYDYFDLITWEMRLGCFCKLEKSGCWKLSVIPSMSLLNASENKININLLVTGSNMTELHHENFLLTDVSREVPVNPRLFKTKYSRQITKFK